MTTTATTITDMQIRQLSVEAGAADDRKTVADCTAALDGDDDARQRVSRVIANARAQEDA